MYSYIKPTFRHNIFWVSRTFKNSGSLCIKTLIEVLFVCFVFRLAATKGIRISRREYLKVNIGRTWLEKSVSHSKYHHIKDDNEWYSFFQVFLCYNFKMLISRLCSCVYIVKTLWITWWSRFLQSIPVFPGHVSLFTCLLSSSTA